jgi:hypothetical protein
LALVIRHTLRPPAAAPAPAAPPPFPPPPAADLAAQAAAFEGPAGLECRRLRRALDSAYNILFDARRRTVHVLTFAHFVATGGLAAFLERWGGVLRLLRALPPPDPAGSAAAPDPAAAAAAKAYRKSVESAAASCLMLMTNLSFGGMLAGSPAAAALATAPLPGAAPPARAAPDFPSFVRRVWREVLAAALPLWEDAATLAAHPRLVPSIATVLRNCAPGEAEMSALSARAAAGLLAGAAAARGAAAAAAAGAAGAPDPARAQAIVDMGFGRGAAEAALRRVSFVWALGVGCWVWVCSGALVVWIFGIFLVYSTWAPGSRFSDGWRLSLSLSLSLSLTLTLINTNPNPKPSLSLSL